MNGDKQNGPNVVDGVWASGGEIPEKPAAQTSPIEDHQVEPSEKVAPQTLNGAWSRDVATEASASSPSVDAPLAAEEQPSAPMSQSSFQSEQPKKKGIKAKTLALVSVATLVLAGVIGGGAYWYMYNNHPDKVLADAMLGSLDDLMSQKPMNVTGDMKFKVAEMASESIDVAIDFSSARSGDNAKGSIGAKVKYQGKDYKLKLEAVGIGTKEIYFKLSNIEQTVNQLVADQPDAKEMSTSFMPIIKKLDNKWVKATEEDLKSLGMTEVDLNSECTKAFESVKLSKADKKKLESSYKENKFMTVAEKMGNEVIDGQKSEHYKLGFDSNSAKSFSKDVLAMESVKPLMKACDITEKDITEGFEEAKKSSQDLSEKNGKLQLEVWINKKMKRPTRMGVSGGDKSVSVSFFANPQFNVKDISIQKPDSSTDLMTLSKDIEALMGGQAGSMSSDF